MKPPLRLPRSLGEWEWISRVLLAGLLLFSAGASARADIVIRDLGTVPFGTASRGYAINDTGVTTGESTSFYGTAQAYRGNGLTPLTNLGALPGGSSSRGLAINADNQVVGRSQVRTAQGGFQTHAFTTLGGGSGLVDLGTLSGGSFSEARSVSDTGVIAGVATNASGLMRAVHWTGNVIHEIETFTSTGLSEAFGINNTGQIVGHAGNSSGAMHAFRYTLGTGPNGDPLLEDLGSLTPGGWSTATSVNDSGIVAGYAAAEGALTHAFLWRENGGMIDLHDPQITGSSYATGISINGLVVGRIESALLGTRAFAWTAATGMIDLNTLLKPSDNWFLTAATGVNAGGEIVGYGVHGGKTRGFVISTNFGGPGPSTSAVPEPASIAQLLAGAAALGLAWGARRRK